MTQIESGVGHGWWRWLCARGTSADSDAARPGTHRSDSHRCSFVAYHALLPYRFKTFVLLSNSRANMRETVVTVLLSFRWAKNCRSLRLVRETGCWDFHPPAQRAARHPANLLVCRTPTDGYAGGPGSRRRDDALNGLPRCSRAVGPAPADRGRVPPAPPGPAPRRTAPDGGTWAMMTRAA